MLLDASTAPESTRQRSALLQIAVSTRGTHTFFGFSILPNAKRFLRFQKSAQSSRENVLPDAGIVGILEGILSAIRHFPTVSQNTEEPRFATTTKRTKTSIYDHLSLAEDKNSCALLKCFKGHRRSNRKKDPACDRFFFYIQQYFIAVTWQGRPHCWSSSLRGSVHEGGEPIHWSSHTTQVLCYGTVLPHCWLRTRLLRHSVQSPWKLIRLCHHTRPVSVWKIQSEVVSLQLCAWLNKNPLSRR